ncbi:cell division protein FtsW, partial [Staphylococcus xylosus]
MLNILRSFKKRLKHLDIGIIISFIILSVIGVIMVYSASMVPASKGSLTNGTPIEANYFMKRQFIFFILSVCIILFISMYFNIKMLRNASTQKFLIVGTFALLILTLLIGKDVNGSRNWINLGLFS